MKQRILLVLSVALLLHTTNKTADSQNVILQQFSPPKEFVVVTADTGYLLDNDDNVAKSIPYMTILDIESVSFPWFIVDGGLKIHRGQVQWSADVMHVRDDKFKVREAYQSLSEATINEMEPEEAIETVQRAIEQIRSANEEETPAIAWFLQALAWHQYSNDQVDVAYETLNTADALLEELKQTTHLQAADVLIIRGIMNTDNGEHTEAIRLFQEALLIQVADLGDDHLQCAATLSHLSHAYEDSGRISQAALTQRLATRVADYILPEAAIELAEYYSRLGTLYHSDGQSRNAVAEFEKAIKLYKLHDEEAANVISMRLQMGDAFEVLEDFEAAEKSYVAGEEELSSMEPEDASSWKKAIINRQALLDHGRGDDSETLSHLRVAEGMYDVDAPQSEDGQTFEHYGIVYTAQNDSATAKKYFVKALKIFALTDGENCEQVRRIDALIADLDGASDGSLDSVVMTSELSAYMFDDEDNFLTDVPRLTVINWNAHIDETDESYGFYTAKYGEHFGNIDETQLRKGRMLPGYFEASSELFKSVVKDVADSQTAMDSGDFETAKTLLENAITRCVSQVDATCTLTLWVKLYQVRLIQQTEGVEAAAEALTAMKETIDSRVPGDYPIQMDAQFVAGVLLLLMAEPETASKKFRTARDIAVERFGTFHADVMHLGRSLAQAMFRSGDVEGSLEEMREVLRIANEIYPHDVIEVYDTQLELAQVLTQTEHLDEALELLEQLNADADRLKPRSQIMMQVLLARVNLQLERYATANEMLPPILKQLQEIGADVSPPAAAVLSDLGRLAIVEEEWAKAVELLSQAVEMHETMQSTNTFECGNARLSLSIALLKLNEEAKAQLQLTAAIESFTLAKRLESKEAKDAVERLAAITPN